MDKAWVLPVKTSQSQAATFLYREADTSTGHADFLQRGRRGGGHTHLPVSWTGTLWRKPRFLVQYGKASVILLLHPMKLWNFTIFELHCHAAEFVTFLPDCWDSILLPRKEITEAGLTENVFQYSLQLPNTDWAVGYNMVFISVCLSWRGVLMVKFPFPSTSSLPYPCMFK